MLENFPTIFNRAIPTIENPFVREELGKFGPGNFLDCVSRGLDEAKFLPWRGKDPKDLRSFAIELCASELNTWFTRRACDDDYQALATVIGGFFDHMKAIYLKIKDKDWTPASGVEQRDLIANLYGDPQVSCSKNLGDPRDTAHRLKVFFKKEAKLSGES